jgi:hypothetical protein
MVMSLFPAGAINDTTFRYACLLHFLLRIACVGMRETDLSRRDTAFANSRPSQRQCELSIAAFGFGGILHNDDRATCFEYIAAALYNIKYTNLTCGDRCQRIANRVSCMPNTRPQCRHAEQRDESTKQGIKHSLAER